MQLEGDAADGQVEDTPRRREGGKKGGREGRREQRVSV